MFKGFYTAATGMVAQQRKTEILTNNVANAKTPGFKTDQSTIRSFPDMLMSAVSSTTVPTENGFALKKLKAVGELNTGVYLQETLVDQTQGTLYSTGLPTDIALIDGDFPIDEASGSKGAIFFRVQNEEGGEAYTRNGNFKLDGNGNLVTPTGLYLLSSTGERIQLEHDNIEIGEDGIIRDENGQQLATIGVSFSANPDTLVKRDNGLFYTINDTELPSAYTQEGVGFSMKQSYLEGSNVDASKSMTELMTAYRSFEANQKVLTAYDRSMEKAVTEIGRVQ